MPERLRYPGFFRRVIFGERLPQEKATEIEEFRAIQQTLHLGRRLRIYYPACGTDISPTYGFRGWGVHIYYNENNSEVCDALVDARLPRRKTTIIQGSALDPMNEFIPKNVDIVIIRNASIEGESFDKTITSLVDPVKHGGYVITNAWGNSAVASELQIREDIQLVGYLARHGGRQVLVQSNLEQVSANLKTEKDSTFGAYPGKTFVFQKK